MGFLSDRELNRNGFLTLELYGDKIFWEGEIVERGEGVVAGVGGVFSVPFGGNNSLCPRSSTILIRVTKRRRRREAQAEGVSP